MVSYTKITKTRKKTMTKKQEVSGVLKELGLSMKWEFVPWKYSRSFKEGAKVGDMSLNYTVVLLHNDKMILKTDYTRGCGHCPSYNQSLRGMSVDVAEGIKYECERGRAASGNAKKVRINAAIEPDICDVFYGLVSDVEADDVSFKEWCGNLGYDPDSRSAERIYNECAANGKALRRAVGADGLQKLRDAFQDY